MLSLLFTATAPQKADVSKMLVPSLKRLLDLCRKHQKMKQEKQKDDRKTEGTQKKNENKREETKVAGSVRSDNKNSSGSEKQSSGHDETAGAPPTKRRRGEDVPTSSDAPEASACPPEESENKAETSTGESSKANQSRKATKTKLSGQLIRKAHTDWVGLLAKIIESVMSKTPQ